MKTHIIKRFPLGILLGNALIVSGCGKQNITTAQSAPAAQPVAAAPASNGPFAAQDVPSADALLDQYEKVVSKFEAIKGPFTIDDMNAINKANIDFATKFQTWQASGAQMSAEQLKRFSDLQTRLAHAMEKASAQPTS